MNPATPVNVIENILPYVDMVLVMSVNPGFSGQSFIPEALDKVRAIRQMLNAKGLNDTLIQVDGGVKPSNVRTVTDAGADVVVMGSAFYGSDDYAATVKETRENAS